MSRHGFSWIALYPLLTACAGCIGTTGGDLFSLFGDNCSITEVLMHTTNDVVEHTSRDADPRQSGRIVNFGGNNWTIENNEFFGGLGAWGPVACMATAARTSR